MIDAPHLHK